MRNLLFMLTILVAGMVHAQRNPISRTISGTIFNVTQNGTENDLAISTEGTYRVVNEDFLDPMYEFNSLEIPVSAIVDLVDPGHTGRFEVLSFKNLTWVASETVDWFGVLDRHSLPRGDINGSIRILREELVGNFEVFEFRLTTSIGDIAVTITGDRYDLLNIGMHSLGLNQIAIYRNSDGQCIPLPRGREYEVLRPGQYTVSTNNGETNEVYTFGLDGSFINYEYDPSHACRN